MMIATAFADLCSNQLWEEVLWLEDQPSTPANRRQIRKIWAEIENREQRRQYLEDHFAWG
jgi:hypothetical protein